MKIKTTSTQKLGVVLGICTGVVIGVVVSWYGYIWDTAQMVQVKKQELASEKESITFLAEIQNQIVDVQNVAQNFDTHYINKDKVVDFIELIETSARKNGVTIQIQAVDIKEGGMDEAAQLTYNYLEMTLRASGSWDQVNMFLSQLEHLPHHVSIESLRLSQNFIQDEDEGESRLEWVAEMSMRGITN